MTWTTFHLSITTPLFNNDDAETGLRVSSMRGAMRFWFRALAGTTIGNDIAALAHAEQHVFGTTGRPGPVRMRLTKRLFKQSNIMTRDNDTDQWLRYLMGLGLSDLKGPTKRYVFGGGVTLMIALSGEETVDALTLASLWLACTYGGFGARTRKGFGGVRLRHINGPLPSIWDGRIDSPGLEHYDGLEHLPVDGPLAESVALLNRIDGLTLPTTPPTDVPLYPVLGDTFTIAALCPMEFDSWHEAAKWTGEGYRRFRASKDHPTANRYSPKLKTPEHVPVIVTGSSKDFGLGALGLPVNYREGTVNVLADGETLRRASPLWLRFVRDPDRPDFRLFSFAFHNTFLPPEAGTVTLKKKRSKLRPVIVTDDDVRARTLLWMNETRAPIRTRLPPFSTSSPD